MSEQLGWEGKKWCGEIDYPWEFLIPFELCG